MIHGEHSVEAVVKSAAEKSVGGIGAECEDFFGGCLLDCGDYDVLLFVAEEAVFAGMGVEGEHGDAWFHDAIVLNEAMVEDFDLFENLFGGDF